MSVLVALGFCLLLIFCGHGCLSLFDSRQRICFWREVISAKNYFVALVLLLLVLNLCQAFDLPAGLAAVLFVPLLVYGLIKTWQTATWRPTIVQLWLLLALLFGVFYLWIYAEKLPLMTWDSWIGWELKARQWVAHGWSIQLADYAQWPQQQEAVFNVTAAYPDGLSLLYYLAHLSGFEFRSMMTVVYLFSYLILLWSVCLRLLQNSANLLLLLTALLIFFSLPLLNNHLLLQGYADVWLAMLILMALLLLSDWNQQHQAVDAVACCIVLLGLPLFKLEGGIWLLLLLLAQLLNHLLIRRHRLYLFAVFALFMWLWFAIDHWSYSFAARAVVISQHYLQFGSWFSVNLMPQNIGSEFLHGLLLQNNWGALYFSLPFVMLSWLIVKYPKQQQVSQTFFILAFVSLLLLFSFTKAAAWATDFTAMNRIILQLTPCYVYLLLQSMLRLQRHRQQPAEKREAKLLR